MKRLFIRFLQQRLATPVIDDVEAVLYPHSHAVTSTNANRAKVQLEITQLNQTAARRRATAPSVYMDQQAVTMLVMANRSGRL